MGRGLDGNSFINSFCRLGCDSQMTSFNFCVKRWVNNLLYVKVMRFGIGFFHVIFFVHDYDASTFISWLYHDVIVVFEIP